MKKSEVVVSSTIIDILQIVFIVLKLCGVITWSWWLVMLPWIICGGLVLIGIILVGIIVLFGR